MEKFSSNLGAYDQDPCSGHAVNGNYHHHTYPKCLAEILGDQGTGHSPLYGFANDGYPIYGPWHSAGVLSTSCWKTRDYSAPTTSTGCSGGQRTCRMVDPFNPSRGTTTTGVTTGPSFTAAVNSLSRNAITTVNGVFYEDYYYDSTCFAQGGQYLNQFNGHDHDSFGFHYHLT